MEVIENTDIIIKAIIPLLGISIQALSLLYSRNKNRDTINQKREERSQYYDMLVKYCSSFDKFLETILNYNRSTSSTYLIIIIGIIAGFIVGFIMTFVSAFILSAKYEFISIKLGLLSSPMYLLTGVNIFNLIFLLCFFLLNRRIKSKNLTIPKLTTKLELEKKSKYVLYSYWGSAGIILGIHIMLVMILAYVFDIWYSEGMQMSLPDNWFLSLYIYLLSIIESYLYINSAGSASQEIDNRAKQKIQDFYLPNFPYITIKTDLSEIEGQIIDITNSTLITLSQNGNLKLVPWDQIKMMEIKNSDKK